MWPMGILLGLLSIIHLIHTDFYNPYIFFTIVCTKAFKSSSEGSMARQISNKGSNRLVTAAIDFGTTYSGYAYTLKHELEKPRTAKEMCQVLTHTWQSGSSAGLISHKTPTSLLLKKDGTFHSFGYDAERKYIRLAERNEHKGWKFFRKFKMMLHNNEVCVIVFYQFFKLSQ